MIYDVKMKKNMFRNSRQNKGFIFLIPGFSDRIAIIGSIAEWEGHSAGSAIILVCPLAFPAASLG